MVPSCRPFNKLYSCMLLELHPQYSMVTHLVFRYSFSASWPVRKPKHIHETADLKTNLKKWRINRRVTQIFAESWLLETAEGSGDVGLVVRVDEDGSCLELLGDVQGLAQVASDHSWRQSVFGGVGPTKNSVDVTTKRKRVENQWFQFRGRQRLK